MRGDDIMKKLLLAAAAILPLSAAVPAKAADLPPRASYKAPQAVEAFYNWTGFYIGANVGWASGTTSISDPDNDWFGATFDRRKSSFIGGGQVGYNAQFGRAVIGMEADHSWLNLGKDTNYSLNNPGHDVLISSKWNWLATVRGRFGMANDNVLLYVTAGAAIAKPTLSWTEFDDPPDSWAEFGNVRVGWTAGGGVEYGISPNWTVKLEGLYVDLGTVESTNQLGYRLEVNNTAFIGRVGVNYRFGYGPVVAKY
jgi:outer membrane immunogenic protein